VRQTGLCSEALKQVEQLQAYLDYLAMERAVASSTQK
jgi:hypothetical protein